MKRSSIQGKKEKITKKSLVSNLRFSSIQGKKKEKITKNLWLVIYGPIQASGSPKVTQFVSLDPTRLIRIWEIRSEVERTGPL